MLAWLSALKISARRDAGPAWGGSLSLLCEVRDIFSWAEDPVALFGETIISQLRAIDAAPWCDCSSEAGCCQSC